MNRRLARRGNTRRAAAAEDRNPKEVTRFDIVYGAVREFDKAKPGWDQGYKDEFKADIDRIRLILQGEEESAPSFTNAS